jgi:hypothetical protein
VPKHRSPETAIGWREWVCLPALGIDRIKCKVDTGARTSSLHAYYIETFRRSGRDYVRFGLHPIQRRRDVATTCVAEVSDRRIVADSGGHREQRYVIVSDIEIGPRRFPIELTLTDRDTMLFRMLLGRTAIQGRYVVDPSGSYLTGRRSAAKRAAKQK